MVPVDWRDAGRRRDVGKRAFPVLGQPSDDGSVDAAVSNTANLRGDHRAKHSVEFVSRLWLAFHEASVISLAEQLWRRHVRYPTTRAATVLHVERARDIQAMTCVRHVVCPTYQV